MLYGAVNLLTELRTTVMKTRRTVVFTDIFCSISLNSGVEKEVLWDCHPNPVNSQAPCNCLGFLLWMYEWMCRRYGVCSRLAACERTPTPIICLKHKPPCKRPRNCPFPPRPQQCFSSSGANTQYMHLSKLPSLLRMSLTSREGLAKMAQFVSDRT